MCPNRSLERKLQRPILAKSRTLPSIPQSPTVPRVHHTDIIDGSPPHRKNLPATTSTIKACTLPPAGKVKMEAEDWITVLFCFLAFECVFTAAAQGNFVESTVSVWSIVHLFMQSLLWFWQSLSKFSPNAIHCNILYGSIASSSFSF